MPDTCPSARIPTEFPTFNTNGITDGPRIPDTCPSARIPTEFPTFNTDGITDVPRMPDTCPSARIPTEFLMFNTDDITNGPRMPDTCPSARIPTGIPNGIADGQKSLAGFSIFLVRISINFRQNYRQKLIAPTSINFRR
jgi:hypothetical protein